MKNKIIIPILICGAVGVLLSSWTIFLCLTTFTSITNSILISKRYKKSIMLNKLNSPTTLKGKLEKKEIELKNKETYLELVEHSIDTEKLAIDREMTRLYQERKRNLNEKKRMRKKGSQLSKQMQEIQETRNRKKIFPVSRRNWKIRKKNGIWEVPIF